MASERRNMFYEIKKQETTEIAVKLASDVIERVWSFVLRSNIQNTLRSKHCPSIRKRILWAKRNATIVSDWGLSTQYDRRQNGAETSPLVQLPTSRESSTDETRIEWTLSIARPRKSFFGPETGGRSKLLRGGEFEAHFACTAKDYQIFKRLVSQVAQPGVGKRNIKITRVRHELALRPHITNVFFHNRGSCLSYGHSCWGAHGKRSGSGALSGNSRFDETRWVLSRLAPLAITHHHQRQARQPQQPPPNLQQQWLTNPALQDDQTRASGGDSEVGDDGGQVAMAEDIEMEQSRDQDPAQQQDTPILFVQQPQQLIKMLVRKSTESQNHARKEFNKRLYFHIENSPD
ncbi:hypothetical protein AAG570_000851 [Ranatra chinensis]|uniref:Uncharacterized protein n=1 Tax=Ranatra chinensis TaxID=642074 RepID=A0ABD0ZF50_9HEMI